MTERRLSRFVQPALSEERIARQWERVQARSARTRAPKGLVAALATACACGVLLAAFLMGQQARQRAAKASMEGAVIEGGAVKLGDGSRLALEAGGRVHVVSVRDDAVELLLDLGTLDLDVPHGRRTLVVHTPRFDVVDLGTRFRVAVDAQSALRVEVSEGSVEVRSRDGRGPARRVEAGESWSNVAPAVSVTSVVSPPAAPAADPSAEAAPVVRDAAPVTGPKELLETGERARLAGHVRAAATAFDTLRRTFRSDPRAALAAFALGRLRLDSLSDAPGAVDALNDAIALSPGGPLREDAEARRVEALAAERSPDCAGARAAFLARYPHSAHAAVVSQQCTAE